MSKKIKNFFTATILLIILGVVCINSTSISSYFLKNYIVNSNVKEENGNTYAKGIDYIFFKQTSDFVPANKEELKNVIYTILDKGWDTYSFYADSNYTDYETDLKEMTNDGTFAAINNYIHPYNSYKSLNVSINNYGIITINIIKNYTNTEIKTINTKVNQIIAEVINNNMTTEEKIKAFHDYIINNTEYDSDEASLVERNISSNLLSYKAYNVLENGLGLCGGYTDTLAIFLNKIGVNNFKVSTNRHIWNAVNLNDTWYHIDMTWDDPVTSNNTQLLIYDYFMITSERLYELDKEKHIYDKNFYLELN